LEGLEISIVHKSEAFEPFFNARFDPEFFQKYYKEIFNKILLKDHEFLGEIAFVTDGEHGNATTDKIGYSKYYGARNVLSGILSDNNVEYISEQQHNKLRKSALTPRDVLISCVGANIGYAAIVPDDIGIANIVRNVALIRSNNGEYINEYLHAYLCSSYGKNLYIRMNTGNAQPLVSLDYIKTIPVFKTSIVFQTTIRKITDLSLDALKESKHIYVSADTLLLDTLGMASFLPSTNAVNIKSFKDSFTTTGRLDAEYYQPKYEQMVSQITAQTHARLIKLVSIQKSIEPGSDAYSDDEDGLPFLRVADYSKHGITKPQKCLNTAFVAENRDVLDDLKPKKNTILFSKDGSVGEAYCLREDANFITSGAVLHLVVRDTQAVLPEYLALALNSILVKMQAERDAGGSIILHWRVGEIENVVVPLVGMPTQEKIAAMVQGSFTLKAKSERLLEVAKRAVEIAIEQNEDAAFAYLKEHGA